MDAPLRRRWIAALAAACAALALGACGGSDDGNGKTTAGQAAEVRFTNPTRITNPWLPLSRTSHLDLRGMKEGKPARSVRTLLKRTKAFEINGKTVQAAIVEDRAYADGILAEIALDYYAQADDGTVHYLGEDVNNYDKTGKRVINHDGAFLYGRDTTVLGVAMPARPVEGLRFTFERIPGEGSETNRVASTNARVKVPQGTYDPALEILGYVLPEKERETKWFGRGVGLLREKGPSGTVDLVRVSGN